MYMLLPGALRDDTKNGCVADYTVADPDLQIGGGGRHPDPEIRGGAGLKKHFRPFGPLGLKIRGGGPPRAPPMDPPLQQLFKRWIEVSSG